MTIDLHWASGYLEQLQKGWTWKPFQHQLDGVWFALRQPDNRCLIADEQGLGKTKTSLIAAKVLQQWYKINDTRLEILVICPVSLKTNWAVEAGSVGVTVAIHSYHKTPKPASTAYMVIADEAHYCQSMKSQRTKRFLDLCQHPNCFGVLELTGTPMKNGRPANLFPLLVGLNHPLSRNRNFYERYYCNAHATKFCKWDITGAANLDDLRLKLSNKLLRRTKEECLDLPPKLYTRIQCENNKAAEEEYQQLMHQLKKDYWNRVENGKTSSKATALVFLGYCRMLASLFKSYQAISLVTELIEQNQSVVVFTDFVDSANRIAEYFGVSPLTGATPPHHRQSLVDSFQSRKTRVFVGTVKAGGVGITLTAANYLIMVDKPWTTGDYYQATDRIHRIGQSQVCNIYDLYAKEIDYVMESLLAYKQGNIDAVLKEYNISVDAGESEMMDIIVKELLR